MEISIDNKRFKALIADTGIKRAIGLMYTENLKDNECMLFIFSNSGYHGIWMHNMRFPIDIFWIDDEKEIVDSVRNAMPCSSIFNCRTYTPKKSAKYVLEIKTKKISKVKVKLRF